MFSCHPPLLSSPRPSPYSHPHPSSPSSTACRGWREDSTSAGEQHGGEDGWQAVPSRPARSQYEKVDTNRLKTLTSSKPVDVDSISFGPPKAEGPGGWGRDSQRERRRQQPVSKYKYRNVCTNTNTTNTAGSPASTPRLHLIAMHWNHKLSPALEI